MAICRQCNVEDDAMVECSGCSDPTPHSDLCHHEDGNEVFCPCCDEFATEDEDEEDEPCI